MQAYLVLRKIETAEPSRRPDGIAGNSPSIPPAEEPAGDDIGLDLGRALEDVADARIAEHAADRIFERVAIAAMDLERVVGIGPGGARGQELRHPGLDVAAAVAVLLARGEICQLARDHGLDRHPGELAEDAGEGIDGFSELLAVERIAKAEFERVLRHAHGARRGLDARALE